jgi:diguanylate cyclase (GGDEF)-like protein/putative nucleotidyltransferase with HDIG domain
MVDMERAISDRLSRQVNVDDLTGLYNRRFLQEELKRKTEEDNAASFALIMMDLDYFKYFNETRGHQAGDRLLMEVAENIVDTVGDWGKVFRSGSDEFAVIVDRENREEALALAETIRENIKNNFIISDKESYWEYDLTASLGLAFCPADGSSREELVNKAEQALYKAKVISGNKVETFFSVLEFLKAQVDASEEEMFNKLTAFLAIINAKDSYTYGHSERVLIYASIIASLMGMPPQAKKHLQYGAYLHDIGKIEIDRSILNNPGKLNNSEWEIITKHPLWGANIARQIKALNPAIPAILYHHERYDGKGYPFNLSGKEIPLEGRIMALADSFDAMTVERPYKKAIPYAEAIAELERNKQIQFDPEMVDLFTDFLRRHQKVEQFFTPKIKEQYLL